MLKIVKQNSFEELEGKMEKDTQSNHKLFYKVLKSKLEKPQDMMAYRYK